MHRLALSLFGAFTLAGAPLAHSADITPSQGGPSDLRIHVPFTPTPADPDPALVLVGEPAPNFAYESPSGWRHLRDLLGQGNLLLVFGSEDRDLQLLSSERDALFELGVVPVAVVDRRSGACHSLARRLQIQFPIVPDPQRVIAAQFNVLDGRTRRARPAWFVLDRNGCVRQLNRGRLPESGWAATAAQSLRLPAPDATLPASKP